MAYPFMPMKARNLRKLTREREESNQFIEVSNRPIEFDSAVADPRCNKTSSRPPIICQIGTEKIISQP
jgi:hypothetical protein